MDKKSVLLPYNFTPNDRKALDFVVQYLIPQQDIIVILYHGYMPIPDIASDGHSVLSRLKENISFLNQKITELETALLEVKNEMVNRGVNEDRIRIVFKPRKKEIAAEIVGLSQTEPFSMIVLNRKPGKVSRFFTGSVFHKVITAVRNTTVCVVS